MKTALLFVIFLMAIEAKSAHGESEEPDFFSWYIGYREQKSFTKVYRHNVDGAIHTVIMNSTAPSADAREVTIEKQEAQERLVFKLGFSEVEAAELTTRVCYGDAAAVVKSYATKEEKHEVDPSRGVGHICLATLDGTYSWKCMTPRPNDVDATRPDFGGIINGNADRIDITQYLFTSVDQAKGHFVRMSVQYANIGAVKFVWGQERYYGAQHHGPAVATKVVGEKVVVFTDAPIPDFPKEPLQKRPVCQSTRIGEFCPYCRCKHRKL